jgi:hypothetical protein
MKYDLAKELADAGFTPRSYVGARFYRSVVSRREGAMPEREVVTQVFDDLAFGPPLYVYIPNLEDLIEACGRDFRTLDRDGSGGKVEWLCNNYIRENDSESSDLVVGRSPVEAVARLWLILHAKREHLAGDLGAASRCSSF